MGYNGRRSFTEWETLSSQPDRHTAIGIARRSRAANREMMGRPTREYRVLHSGNSYLVQRRIRTR